MIEPHEPNIPSEQVKVNQTCPAEGLRSEDREDQFAYDRWADDGGMNLD
jgi:hypothetical protein